MRIFPVTAFAVAAAGLFAAPAYASIPPVGWDGPKWTGPGLLCKGHFTLELAEGETAEQQYPSVGLIRYVVRSDKGVFEVAEDWYARPYEERELVEKREGESVFKVTASGYDRTYLMLSKAETLPILVRFDPLMSAPPSFVEEEAVKSVLDRVSSGQAERDGCLEEIKPADKRSN